MCVTASYTTAFTTTNYATAPASRMPFSCCMKARLEGMLPPLPEPMDIGMDEGAIMDEWLQDGDALFTSMTF